MQQPKNYTETKAYNEYTPLDPGGYVCKVLKVEEVLSKSKKPMLNIILDIAEGDKKGYFAEQYKADTRPDKKWSCIVYQLTEDKEGNCNRGLKTFIECVTASNPGFNPNIIWGDNFCKYFKDKLIGGMFRREEYENQYGESKWSTKCYIFRTVDAIREGVEVPEDKPLEQKTAPTYAGFNEGASNEKMPWDE